jgi:plastocyanin
MAPSGAYRVGVNPYRVHVQPGDTVEFMIVPPNQVSVHQLTFVDVSPAERAQQVFSGEGGTFLVVIREDAPLDLYKYSIAFVIGTRIFFRDPEIEVGDPDN